MINVKFNDRAQYDDTFNAFDKNSATEIVGDIVDRALCGSYHKRLAYPKGKSIVTLADLAMQGKQSHSNLLNKANHQTIEAFWRRGSWKAGGKLEPLFKIW